MKVREREKGYSKYKKVISVLATELKESLSGPPPLWKTSWKVLSRIEWAVHSQYIFAWCIRSV